MKLNFSSFSIPGRKGPNQDSILEPVEVGSGFWCAIADGVGGRPNGDVASLLAVNTVEEALLAKKNLPMSHVFNEVLAEFNLAQNMVVQEKPMATTLSVLNLIGNTARVGHIGDTRIYHLRNEGILRRTKDQTEVQNLMDRGVINRRQAARYHRKNVLNGYISSGKELLVVESEFQIESGDRIILLTDGVYGSVPMKSIRDISLESETTGELAEKLKGAVENSEIIDDYSALVLAIENN